MIADARFDPGMGLLDRQDRRLAFFDRVGTP